MQLRLAHTEGEAALKLTANFVFGIFWSEHIQCVALFIVNQRSLDAFYALVFIHYP